MAKKSPSTKKSTELMSPKDVGIPREAEAALTKSERLQFLTLCQGGSQPVLDNEPKGVRGGDYLLGKTILLGAEFDAIVSISRPRAMIWEEGKVVLETFDPSSEEWSKCKAARKGGNTGIEFLIWIPGENAFSTFYFKNTAKEVGAKAALARDNKKVARFGSRLVEGKENSWFVPTITEVDPEEALDLPNEEQQREAVAAFESYKQEKKVKPAENARPR